MVQTATNPTLPALPPEVTRVLQEFVASARTALGPDLVSMALFGTAAEGRLRATSDVNMVVVLARFTRERVDSVRLAARSAEAAVQLAPMFVLESELDSAAEAFADKFADIVRRRHVICGSDPFAALMVPRAVLVARERQSLLNLAIRLRNAYVLRSLRAEQASAIIADYAGPLRVAAATLCELAGTPAPSPKEALKNVVARWGEASVVADVDRLSAVGSTRAGSVNRR